MEPGCLRVSTTSRCLTMKQFPGETEVAPIAGYVLGRDPTTDARTSSPASASSAAASCTSVPSEGWRRPRSSSEMKVRSKPLSSASFSCDSPRPVRVSLSTRPNDCWRAELSTAISQGRYEWLDHGSTDYSRHCGRNCPSRTKGD